MTTEENTKKLLDEATKLLTDIALNKSGFTSDHAVQAMEFVAKARNINKPRTEAVCLPQAA